MHTDVDISKLSSSKDVPLLCVQLFRAADFFQLEELKLKVMKQLELSLYDVLKLTEHERIEVDETGKNGKIRKNVKNVKNGKDQDTKHHTKILHAVEDAYKDGSTTPVLELLLDFMYKNSDRIFRFPKAVSLLDKHASVGKDLMKKHINEVLTKRTAKPKFQLGLPVLAAIQSPAYFFKAGATNRDPDGSAVHCRLYPVVYFTNTPFLAVDPNTDTELGDLHWITPDAQTVTTMGTHPDSKFVQVLQGNGYGSTQKELYIRFERCGDARLYVELYKGQNSRIDIKTTKDSDTLNKMAPRPLLGPSRDL